jgi:perosamine synthetase
MMATMQQYPLFKVHVPTDQAIAQIRTVFDSGFINEGVQVGQLTEALKSVLNTQRLVLLNSCTSALTLALKLAGVGPGDEVISTPMTCVATNTAIVAAGGTIVWADIDPRHGMIDPEDVARKVTPKTKAVMAVAWAGTPPNLFLLHRMSKALSFKLILDAAHAFDASYKNLPVHVWADFTCYSFQAIKHFTTGDGGALVCYNNDDYVRAKSLKWFGMDRDRAKDEKGDWKGQQWDVDIEEAGFKYNMNNVSAAIGLSQLPHIDQIMAQHRDNGAQYDSLFEGFTPIVKCQRPAGSHSSFWVYTVLVDPKTSRLGRNALLKALNAEGIMAGVVHVPNDDYICFRGSKVDLPGVRQFSANQLSLPCGWWLNHADIEHVAARVIELTQ